MLRKALEGKSFCAKHKGREERISWEALKGKGKEICGKCSGERKEKLFSGSAEVIVGKELLRKHKGKKVLKGGKKIF